jgi:hypothetical protein
MMLRPHRRNLVVWNQSVGPAGRDGAPRVTRFQRTRCVRRGIRTGRCSQPSARSGWPAPRGPTGGLCWLEEYSRREVSRSTAAQATWFSARSPVVPPAGPANPSRSEALSAQGSKAERKLAGCSTAAHRRDL